RAPSLKASPCGRFRPSTTVTTRSARPSRLASGRATTRLCRGWDRSTVPFGSRVMKRAPATSRAKVSRWKPAGRVIGVSCATAGAARSISTMPTRAQRMPESYYAPQVRLALEQVADELLEILDPERLVEDGCARLLEEVLHPDRLGAPRHEGDAPRQLGLAALE